MTKEEAKAYYGKNKERIKRIQKKYREKNKAKRKENYGKNKEIIQKERREYYRANKERINNNRKVATQRYYKKNKEKILEYQKKYCEANKEKRNLRDRKNYKKVFEKIKLKKCESTKRYYAKNNEKVRRYGREYYHKNKELYANLKHIRRAKIKGNGNSDITRKDLQRLLNETDYCVVCSCKMEKKSVDHIKPINVGGTHTLDNIRIICLSCNQRRPKDGRDILTTNNNISQYSLNI